MVSVVVIDNRQMRRLNRTYLGHDYPTDVIAFPLEEGKRIEGEIYVNADRARIQARRYRVSFNEEVARLVIHGTLHLAGYDDTTRRASAVMKEAEDRELGQWFDSQKGRK